MQQTFKKSINHYPLQFNRLLYPLRYTIKVEDGKLSSSAIEIRKDGNGRWETSTGASIPSWVEGVKTGIVSAIEENESTTFSRTF